MKKRIAPFAVGVVVVFVAGVLVQSSRLVYSMQWQSQIGRSDG